MTIILRLDPALPAIWRSPEELQFGVPAAAVLSPVEPWQQRLIGELASGMPESAVMVWAEMLRVNPERVRDLLVALSPAIMRIDPDLPAAVPRVVLHSSRPSEDARLVSALRGVFVDAGITVNEHSSFDADVASASVSGAGRAAVVDAVPPIVVVLAHFAVDPRLSAALLSRDATHLPIVVDGGGVRVGPMVVPGVTGCLHCTDLHRIDNDPAWPVLATQLLERAAVAPSPLLALEAAAIAARFILPRSVAPTGPSAESPGSLSVSVRAGDARREWHRHRPHPSCGCQSLAESATAHASRARPSVTTTTRAMRVPA